MEKLMSFFSFFFDSVSTTITHAWRLATSEKGYSALFKAGIVLVSASMLAIAQAGAIVYSSDIESHRAKFEVEAVLKGDLENASQCFALPVEHVAKCRSAVYELAQVNAAWELTLRIFEGCFRLGSILLGLSIVGFVAGVPKQIAQP